MNDESSLSLSSAEQVDLLCDRFERAWRSAQPLRIGDVLGDRAEPVRAKLFRELLALDLDYRQRQGDSPTTEEYLSSFPEYDTVITDVFHEFSSSPKSELAASAPMSSQLGDAAMQAEKHKVVPGRQDLPKSGQGDESVTLQRPQFGNIQLAAGSFLGRFEVVGLLGRGAFGAVYRARDSELDRDVALKVPHETTLADETDARQFLNEARAAGALKHPGIVTVYDVCRLDDGRCFVVMEYVPGRTLSVLVKSQQVSQEQAVELIAAIAEAVHFAHRRGLFHRDLKPANILVDPEGNPRVCDFGLALHESRQRASAGQYAGTPSYMAPEQVRGEAHRLDGRADIWALGVMLYDLLTGRRPFQGDTFDELAEEILYRDPKPSRQIDETISEELQRICLRCLARTVTERYASAYDLARDLRRLGDAPRKTPRTLLYSLAAVALICLILVLSYVASRSRQSANEQQPSSAGPPAASGRNSDTDGATVNEPEEANAMQRSRLVPLAEADKSRALDLAIDESNQADYDEGYINFTSDVDVYRLVPSVSGRVEIRVVPDLRRGFGLEPVVSLYAPPATSSVSDHDGSFHAKGAVQFAYPSRVGNIYYLAIAAKDQASAGRYKLSILPSSGSSP